MVSIWDEFMTQALAGHRSQGDPILPFGSRGSICTLAMSPQPITALAVPLIAA